MQLTENQLDEWVRGNSKEAQGLIVELVWRLVAASSPSPKQRRFPLGDSIGQHGADGFLEVDLPYDPFIPEGRSFWEIGTGLKAGDKATSDYRELTDAVPDAVKRESTFIFVTPLSARRDWEFTWKNESQASWLTDRVDRKEWKDVRILDGTRLIDWVHQFPAVGLWLAKRTLGIPTEQIEIVGQRWNLVRSYGEPPPLIPRVFLENRTEACEKMKQIFSRTSVQLKLNTRFPDQVVDFVAAYVASLDDDSRIDAESRCLIISGPEAWNSVASLRVSHILVADSLLDLTTEAGSKLIQRARNAGHAVVFGGSPSGIPDPASAALLSPRDHQLRDALQTAGYKEERARTLAQKCGGNLGSLLRCIQNLSIVPAWADGSAAAELTIAELLGAWDESSQGDLAIVEDLSGNSYGEWIGKMREIALRPSTPLTHWNGNWKFIARYEGWYALGSRVFDDHLVRLQRVAISALGEIDPQFELPPDERYVAGMHGKVPTHSRLLRNGIAESLALLGSHSKALLSCSHGNAEGTATLTVRSILANADWLKWSSLDDVLPLLAEASPNEFLNAIERAINEKPCPFIAVFAQEGRGLTGRTYMTGLLWALETLAWDANYLGRAATCLAELANLDPGGQWANRPANSLTTIFLPWMPQTCAPVPKRLAVISMLLRDFPDIAWKLLLSLLPRSQSASSGTRKPAWRETIPEDWTQGVTRGEYKNQVDQYCALMTSVATTDDEKLSQLVDQFDSLPPTAQDQVFAHLDSDAVSSLEDPRRLRLWTELTDLVVKHRKFVKAEWAMKTEQVDRLAALAERLVPSAPAVRNRRLFSEREFDLYEETENYEQQRDKLELRRQNAVTEILATGGIQSLIKFADAVASPWRAGISFGAIAQSDGDDAVLPHLISEEKKSLGQFAGGFVSGKFRTRGWIWVDQLDFSKWTKLQIGLFLSYLPFFPATWERVGRLLADDASAYWENANANPYETEVEIDFAIDQLIRHQRPYSAVRCLYGLVLQKKPISSQLAVKALVSSLRTKESSHANDGHEVVEIIKYLQNDSNVESDDLFRIEWAYLQLLSDINNAQPKCLGWRMATQPDFFCEVIQLVFKSKKEDASTQKHDEDTKSIATNAYRLLHQWRVPPGLQKDGTYSGGELDNWLNDVMKKCAESGHLEIALTMVGHVLFYVPPDVAGLWIDRSAASALNSKDGGDMRNGYRIELFNSRGAYWVDPTGKPEKDLAEKIRGQAEALDVAGFYRFAASLREVADSYEREAERTVAKQLIDG